MATKYGWKKEGIQYNSPDGRWAAAYVPWQRGWTLFVRGRKNSATPARTRIRTLKGCVDEAARRA